MPEEWRPPTAPNVTQDFNEAARDQAKKEVPLASEGGIATKNELDKRTEMERILRERLERKRSFEMKPKNEIAKDAATEKFQNDKVALEENAQIKEKIRQQLEKKKQQDMSREFNRVAGFSRD